MRKVQGMLVCLVTILYGVLCIDILNGRYRNVSIVIQNTVKEDDRLIERVKEIFTKASKFLFEATRHQVYFGEIKIIIPKSWSLKPEYQQIPVMPAINTHITIDESNVKVPHTKRKIRKCGSPGWYMYLPASFVLQKEKTEYGFHEYVVVHEWGHLRWGLWDEYETPGRQGVNVQFYLENGEWKPVRCSESVKGKVGEGFKCTPASSKCDIFQTTKLIDESCKFCPDETQSFANMSSLMAFNWIDAVTTFCDNDTTVPVHQRHNRNSPNKQNEICASRSSWEVMRDHSDFESATTLSDTTNTKPAFIIQQETVAYRVLALDVSGSMSGSSITKLLQASELFINSKFLTKKYSWLGIVGFNGTSFIMKNLTQITTEAVRDDLLSALPRNTTGTTCIGCGIKDAITLLRLKLDHLAGSEIIVISDGRDNMGDLNASIQSAVDASVTIHTMSISQSADTRMIDMATATGGKHVSYFDGGAVSMTLAFLEMLSSTATSFATDFVTLVAEQYNTLSHNVIHTSFNLDGGLGNGTSISILQGNAALVQVNVSGPNGISYSKKTTGDNIILDMPNEVIAGQYNVSITTQAPSLELYVTSLPISSEIVRVFSWLSPINYNYSSGNLPVMEVDVMKGRAAVLNSVVTALVQASSTEPCEVSLIDDGIDPDDSAQDGVYAGVIPAHCIGGNGRVSAKVNVRGESGKTYIHDYFSGAGSPQSDKNDNSFEVLQENFQRTVLTNEILVENYNIIDVTAPGRIKDVAVIDISTMNTQFGESRNFTVTWTATGDDVNIGQALRYECRISSDKSILENDFPNAQIMSFSNTNFTPKASGQAEYIKIEIDAEESFTSTSFFAVRAIDEVGNKGAVSNIISILVANGHRMKVTESVAYSSNNKNDQTAKMKDNANNSLTIGISIGSVVIFIIALIAVIRCVKGAKDRETVADCEYGRKAPTTTASKKVFQSSKLESYARSEQNCITPLSTKSFSTLPQGRRMSDDIVSQSSCYIDIEHKQEVVANEENLEKVTGRLPFEITSSGFEISYADIKMEMK